MKGMFARYEVVKRLLLAAGYWRNDGYVVGSSLDCATSFEAQRQMVERAKSSRRSRIIFWTLKQESDFENNPGDGLYLSCLMLDENYRPADYPDLNQVARFVLRVKEELRYQQLVFTWDESMTSRIKIIGYKRKQNGE